MELLDASTISRYIYQCSVTAVMSVTVSRDESLIIPPSWKCCHDNLLIFYLMWEDAQMLAGADVTVLVDAFALSMLLRQLVLFWSYDVMQLWCLRDTLHDIMVTVLHLYSVAPTCRHR